MKEATGKAPEQQLAAEPTKISRRRFLATGAAAGAGLVIGAAGVYRYDPAPGASAEAFAPNVWLQVPPTGKIAVWVHRTEMGQGIRTTLAALIADELDVTFDQIEVVQAVAHKKYGNQLTGGSTSVRRSWKTLREAGAAARAMLVAAAAKNWNVDPATCQTDAGHVMHPASGRRLTYQELASAAAELDTPKTVQVKAAADRKLIGKSFPRVDMQSKVDGSAVFGLDVRVPDMLFASVERSPHIGGKLSSVDDSAARKVSGVVDVVQLESGVAVLASSTYAAFKGREQLKIAWSAPPAELSSESMMRELKRSEAADPGVVARLEGKGSEAIGDTAELDVEYEVPYLAHAAMEPVNCTVHVKWPFCEVWAPTQVPQHLQERVASILRVPKHWVTVHVTLVGGSFGRRLETDYVVDAVRLSRKTGRPVQVVWTREDDMRHDFYRPMVFARGRAKIEGGQVSSAQFRLALPSISWQKYGELKANGVDNVAVEGAAQFPYKIPNLQVDFVKVDLPVQIGYWRSVGHSHNGFIIESFVDEMAHALRRDPYEFRMSLLAIDSREAKTLKAAAEAAGWGKPLKKGRARGIAVMESYGSCVAHVAEVSVEGSKIRVHRVVVAVECGQALNPSIIEAQLQGGAIFGMSAALYGEIQFADGRVLQSNYHDYDVVRQPDAPVVEVVIVPSERDPGGIGETGVPPIAPAIANAVFALTGKRLRRLPLRIEA